MRVEVRCCCQPQKLLGWLDVPRDVRPGDSIRFPIVRVFGSALAGTPLRIQEHSVELPVAVFQDGSYEGIAFKSEETPIETLRMIRGFTENQN